PSITPLTVIVRRDLRRLLDRDIRSGSAALIDLISAAAEHTRTNEPLRIVPIQPLFGQRVSAAGTLEPETVVCKRRTVYLDLSERHRIKALGNRKYCVFARIYLRKERTVASRTHLFQ